MKYSQLNLVDLAGSEGVSKTQADGLRLREGSNINRSLLALSNVINKLSQGNGKSFINYRDSKMTRILQSSLGGNSKTAIICTMTQTLSNYQETVNTLHFGQKAKHVKTKVNVNEISQSSDSPELEKANQMIMELKERLRKFEDKLVPSCSSFNADGSSKDEIMISMEEQKEGDNFQLTNTQRAIQHTHDISITAMRDQIKFMQDKLQ